MYMVSIPLYSPLEEFMEVEARLLDMSLAIIVTIDVD
jgi:hypothetical protein